MIFPPHGILFLVIFMNNIPVFTTQGGTATLILREIPISGKAYVLLRTVLPGQAENLVAECASFCKMCGAEQIFASWADGDLPFLAPAYDIYLLHVEKSALPDGQPVRLVPMTPENDAIYQRIYNRCFSHVSHAASYDRGQIARIYREHQRAFLALDEDERPYGIGELHGDELAAIAVLPKYRGRGMDLAISLLHLCPGEDLKVTVVSDNASAMRLYEKLGFHLAGVESKWFRV
jgi:GNAT superfamily N-acetyltransferase